MNIYLVIVLAALVGEYALAVVVEWLNLRHLSATLPDEFEGCFDAAKYSRSQSYLRENTRFDLVTRGAFTLLTVVFILAGGFHRVDNLARGFGLRQVGTGLVFCGLILLASQLLHIPFSAYHTFVIEERYGFNRTTWRTFLLDLAKGGALAAVLGGALLGAVLWLFQTAGVNAWALCWGVVILFEVFVLFLAPVLLMPLFNKFVPLGDGDLRRAIEDYARTQNFRMQGIFTMDGSKRSSKSNAFFTGFGRFRRIVLYDTLVARHTTDELVAVLAHEMGHYRKGHIAKSIALSICTSGLMFYLLSLLILNPGLFAAFRMGNISVYAGLFFASMLYSPLGVLMAVLSNVISRKHEYEADRYAVKSTGRPEPMIAALKRLTVDNLQNLTPHPIKVFLDYSHPPVQERIEALRRQSVT